MTERIGKSARHHRPDGPFDAVVIGSGVGGLACAGALAKYRGMRVLVLERHYAVGGFTHVFNRQGYEWDVGVHYVGDVHRESSMAARVFSALTEGKLKWAPMPEVYDRVFLGEEPFDFVAGREAFRERMKRYFPRSAAGIDGYLEEVRRTQRAARSYYMEKVLPRPIAATVGTLLARPYVNAASRTTAQVMARHFTDPNAIGVLTGQWGDYGLPPSQSSWAIHAAIVDHYAHGAAYPIGGSARIAQTLVPPIHAAGGEVLYHADVKEILIENGRAVGVRLEDGHPFHAPVVVSSAGLPNTLTRLLPRAAAESTGWLRHLQRVPPSLGHLCLYAGLEHSASALGLDPANLWIYPDADHDGNLKRALSDPESPAPFAYISFPSAKDPEWESRHPGRATIEIITAAAYDPFRQWEDKPWRKRGGDYEALKQRLSERLLDILYRRVPQVRGKIVYHELSTPLSTRHFDNAPHGEIYGLAHTPQRFGLRLPAALPLRGLYLAGQDLVSAGVVGALIGGVLAASAIARANLLARMMKDG